MDASRNRRTYLRKNGSDRFGYSETMLIGRKGLWVPKCMLGLKNYSIPIKNLNENRNQCLGPPTHEGVRLILSGDEILVFSRICSYQGTDLSNAKLVEGKIRCSWHGL
tara:strand:+ start:825 stop:1148 length:324 start_codon:yes stop_codon:yes gene_type:complete